MKELETLEEVKLHLQDNTGPFLFYFTAKWCGPCRSIYPMLLKLEEGISTEKLEFIKIDIDENDEFSDKNDIRSVPTFLLYKDNEVKDRITGADIHKVGELIKTHIV